MKKLKKNPKRRSFLLNILWVIALTLQSNVASSQNSDWYQFDIDSIVSIQFPTSQVYELDTVINRVRLYQLRADVSNSSLSMQKLRMGRFTEEYSLPKDSLDLMKFYDGVIKGLTNKSGFQKKEDYLAKKGQYYGKRVELQNIEGNTLIAEMYLLNDYLYKVLYLSDSSFNKEEQNDFMNSFVINNNAPVSQFKQEPTAFSIGFLIGKLSSYLLMIAFVIWLIMRFIKSRK